MIGINRQEFEKFLYFKRGRSKGGVKTALGILQTIENWLNKNNYPLKQEGVEAFFVAKKKKGLTNGTLISYRTIIRLLEEFLDKKLLSDIKIAKPVRHVPDILSEKQVTRLLSTDLSYGTYGGDDASRLNDVYKTMTEFLYVTGCRIKEAITLEKKHLLSDSSVLFTDTKNGEERIVYVYPPCYDRMSAFVEGSDPSETVFRNMKGNTVVSTSYREDLKKRAKSAGIDIDIHPHTLRHTFASHMAQRGVDVRVVQKILGHKKLDSTIYYEQFNKDRQIDAVHTLSYTQLYLSVLERIKRVKREIESFNLPNDDRLEYSLRETTRYGKKGLIVEVFER